MSQIADTKVARRYARALFGVARRKSREAVIQRDLSAVVETLTQSPRLKAALESPLLPAERKTEVIRSVFASDLDPMTLAFLNLLVEKRRENILLAVQQEYGQLADVSQGLLRVHALVAAPLSDTERIALESGLQKRTGKRIQMDVQIEPALLGGVVVRMQDTVIDGSVRGALERIREQMLNER